MTTRMPESRLDRAASPGLNNVFGARCSDKANNARSWWPNADTDPFGAGKYVFYHTYLARNIGFNIRNHINAAHRDGALYPGIGGYNCRLIDGVDVLVGPLVGSRGRHELAAEPAVPDDLERPRASMA